MSTFGPEYQEARDGERIAAQLDRVRDLMLDGKWRTLKTIGALTASPTPSVSAQLRHLRKERFGSYTVERRHVENGLYEYRVLPPRPAIATGPPVQLSLLEEL